MKPDVKKIIITNLPYLLFVWLFGKVGEAWRLAAGADASQKMLHFMDSLAAAFANGLPSFHPFDLCSGFVLSQSEVHAVFLGAGLESGDVGVGNLNVGQRRPVLLQLLQTLLAVVELGAVLPGLQILFQGHLQHLGRQLPGFHR